MNDFIVSSTESRTSWQLWDSAVHGQLEMRFSSTHLKSSKVTYLRGFKKKIIYFI